MSNCPSRSNKDSTAIAPVAAVGNDVGLGLELSPPIVEVTTAPLLPLKQRLDAPG